MPLALLLLSFRSFLPFILPTVKPPKAQSLPHTGALEAWETHIPYRLFQNTPPRGSLMVTCNSCTRIALPINALGSPDSTVVNLLPFLPSFFPQCEFARLSLPLNATNSPCLHLSQLCVSKDDATQHNGIAAHHRAAQEKLLERWLWTKESMESATAKEVKPPNPGNYLHCVAKTTSLPRRAKGNGCSLNGSLFVQKSPVVLLGPLLNCSPG